VAHLRAEVAKLQASAQRDAKDRETLHGMIDRLKTELRHALDENRRLTDGLEERKQLLDAQSERREAAAREQALKSAKNLFKSMLQNSRENVQPSNSREGREHDRISKASPHKRQQRASAPPAGCP
jgi:hypothetical protein